MQVQKRHDGFLSNFEVRDLLMRHAHSEKQAKQAGEAQSSARSEHRWLRHHVLEYLDSAPAKRTRAKDIQRLVEELRACEQRFSSFRITPSEIMQLANLRPKESVVAHLIIEECAERLTDEEVEELKAICLDCIPAAPAADAAPPAAGEEDGNYGAAEGVPAAEEGEGQVTSSRRLRSRVQPGAPGSSLVPNQPDSE